MKSEMPDSLALRSLRWLISRQRERLAATSVLTDLEPFHTSIARFREMADLSTTVLEELLLFDSEIAAREEVQARAKRVLSDSDAFSTCTVKHTGL